MKFKQGLRTLLGLWTSIIFILICLPIILWVRGEFVALQDLFSKEYGRQKALDISNRTEEYINGTISSILSLADSPVIQTWMLNEFDPLAQNDAFWSFNNFSKTMENAPGISAAIANSLNYYYTNSLRTTLSPNNPVDDWFFESLDREERVAIHIDYDPNLRLTRFWINAIVHNPLTKGLAGILSAGIDISVFLQTILELDNPDFFIVFFDGSDSITAYRDSKYVTRANLISLLDIKEEREAVAEAKKHLQTGKERSFSLSLDHRGTRHNACLVYIPTFDWYALVFVDPAQLINLNRFIPVLLSLMLSIALLFGSILGFTSLRVIRPIKRVTRVMQEIKAGESQARVKEIRHDEIGDLERACNTMADEISAYTSSLEEMVRTKTDELVKKNHELVDSLSYARNIQTGILPDQAHISRKLPQHALIWRPKNIVSGDLYWYKEVGDNMLLALVDCVEDGIPGALLSIAANSILDHIVWELYDDPTAIVQEFYRLLKEWLGNEYKAKSPESQKEIEIALVMLSPETRTIRLVSSGMPIYYLSKDGIEVTGQFNTQAGEVVSPLPIICETKAVQPKDKVFIATDGLFLQTNSKGELFRREVFDKVLIENMLLPVEEQRNQLLIAFDRHRQSSPQGDDITVFGFSIPEPEKRSEVKP